MAARDAGRRAPGAGDRRDRGPEARQADHLAIDRLADELLPALVAKLGASGLGEIEIREGGWKIRLRRPPGGIDGVNHGRRATDRPSRPQPGHAGHGHPPAAVEGHRPAAMGAPAVLAAVGPGRVGERPHPHRAVATSPAVGIFQPRPEMRPGTRVRAGDRLGFVDVLGVRQEVTSPVDGIVGSTLVEAGDAVEYGQELVRLELAGPPVGGGAGTSGDSADGGRPTGAD